MVAARYAEALSRTPVQLDEELVSALRAAFAEREIVVLALIVGQELRVRLGYECCKIVKESAGCRKRPWDEPVARVEESAQNSAEVRASWVRG